MSLWSCRYCLMESLAALSGFALIRFAITMKNCNPEDFARPEAYLTPDQLFLWLITPSLRPSTPSPRKGQKIGNYRERFPGMVSARTAKSGKNYRGTTSAKEGIKTPAGRKKTSSRSALSVTAPLNLSQQLDSLESTHYRYSAMSGEKNCLPNVTCPYCNKRGLRKQGKAFRCVSCKEIC